MPLFRILKFFSSLSLSLSCSLGWWALALWPEPGHSKRQWWLLDNTLGCIISCFVYVILLLFMSASACIPRGQISELKLNRFVDVEIIYDFLFPSRLYFAEMRQMIYASNWIPSLLSYGLLVSHSAPRTQWPQIHRIRFAITVKVKEQKAIGFYWCVLRHSSVAPEICHNWSLSPRRTKIGKERKKNGGKSFW